MLIIIPRVTNKKISLKYNGKNMRRQSKWYITKKIKKKKGSSGGNKGTEQKTLSYTKKI